MKLHRMMSVCGLLAMAAGASAQTVEFRIVERQGQQAIVTPLGTTATTDAVLSFALQARVTGGAVNTGLGNFQCKVHIVGEPDANGTLARARISNADGTYALNPNQSANSTVGQGGLAAAYIYLAGISGAFNGIINGSSGSHTNSPDQDIGLITGAPVGGSMLRVTDLDASGDPDTYTGTVPSASGAMAALDPVLANTYFGANGNWIDVYRFKYTVSNTGTSRVLHVTLEGNTGGVPDAQTFVRWEKSNEAWGPGGIVFNSAVSVQGLDIPIGSVGACCDTATGVCAMVDGAGCANGTFAASGTCTPSPCPVMGSCCASGGACTLGAPGACVGGQWTLGRPCVPNSCQQLVLCCDAAGACTLVATCGTGVATVGSSCTPNPCPQLGACCDSQGACTQRTGPNCEGPWIGGACTPNQCPQLGACCSYSGACSIATMPDCGGAWLAGTCGSVTCPAFGRCCASSGLCTLTPQASCAGTWTAGGTCGAGACPVFGACCQREACVQMASASCGQAHGQYRGDNVACLPAGAFNACCVGNFDGQNGLAVQDIFAFLNAWFAADLRADIDQNSVLSIYDIYAFLGAWRSGC